MVKKIIAVLAIAGLSACQNHPSADKTEHTMDSSMPAHTEASGSPALKALSFDYKKDPACGMPLAAGLEDSTLYKGKLYGFCSKECKAAFLKDPASYVAAIK